MPEKQTLRRARKAKREGKAPSTQAGEFVREEIEQFDVTSTARARPSRPQRSDCPGRGAHAHLQRRCVVKDVKLLQKDRYPAPPGTRDN